MMLKSAHCAVLSVARINDMCHMNCPFENGKGDCKATKQQMKSASAYCSDISLEDLVTDEDEV